MIKIAVLISDKGKGTNLQAIIDAIQSGKINGEIVVVVSDTWDAAGLLRAKKNNLQIAICREKNQLKSILLKFQPDFIALAGWKQIIADAVINSFQHQIINLHPGLVPNTINGTVKNPDGTDALWNRGLLAEKAINNFLQSNATYGGSSIHFLTKEFDFGKVLVRTFVKINKNDTVDSLYSRIKNKEHHIYVEVLQKLSMTKKTTVLVVDGGGRGSVLTEAYLKSSNVKKVLAVPGNDLMTMNKNVSIFPHLKTTDIDEIVELCKRENIDLVDVAQDDAVAAGLVDTLKKEGIKVFGPTKAAGQIEWDKAWARDFMKSNKLPIPRYKICKSEKDGINFIKDQKDSEWYVKVSGLAAGKGALHAKNNQDAIAKIKQMKKFGKAGRTYLIEECLEGEEFSSFAIVNGKNFEIVGHAQDHKTVLDGNIGPNTGGMGCSSPPMAITKKVEVQITSIFRKTIEGLVKIGRPYIGILYLGGLIDKQGKVQVIEFNARWGDPEAQVLIPAIKNDFYSLMSNALRGNLQKIIKDKKYRVVVTAASKGYPGNYNQTIGKEIKGLDELLKNRVKIYGAGVAKKGKRLVVNGGRLFYVLGEGKNVAEARKKAYNVFSQVSVTNNGLHYRKDIGYRDLERLKRR